MDKKVNEHDFDTKLILKTRYDYSNDDAIVKVCKYCNEVLKYNTDEYFKGCHTDKCKVGIGNAQRLIEKIDNNENVGEHTAELIDVLVDGVKNGEINRSFAKRISRVLDLNINFKRC